MTDRETNKKEPLKAMEVEIKRSKVEVHAEKCPVCNGFGTVSSERTKCHGCNGKGWVCVPNSERSLAYVKEE